MKKFIIINVLFLCVALGGCYNYSIKDRIRLHNSSGFSEQAADYASYDPSTAVPDDDGRILALNNLAQKDSLAAYDLALRFFRGDGVLQNSYMAIQWMRNAAERGNIDAQKALGRLYLTGFEEMGSDPQEAEKWLRIAANRGDTESEKLLKAATQARKNEADYFRWKTSWQSRFYYDWYYSYPYRYYWRHGKWQDID